jgi:hypothetical protein
MIKADTMSIKPDSFVVAVHARFTQSAEEPVLLHTEWLERGRLAK